MHVCLYTYIDNSWAVGAYQAGGALAQEPMFDFHHVLLRDALSDAHYQGNLSINSLDDGCRSKWRGHINHSSICPCALPCLK